MVSNVVKIINHGKFKISFLGGHKVKKRFLFTWVWNVPQFFPPHFSQKIPLFLPSPSFWCICLPKFPRPIWNKLYFICVYVYKTKITSFTEIQYFYWKAFFSYKKWLPQCNVSTTLPYQKTLCMPILLKEQNKKQNLVYIFI